jgi:2-polyprenyl-3-methyl-5-hydroxy-6-metoxy-1,4-benzoquinol methylase
MSHPLEYHNFVMAEVDKSESSVVLDVGVGFGIWGYLMRVLRKPSLLVGIDVNLDYLLTLKKHNFYDCLVLASGSYLPFRRRIFDYVLAVEVLEHLPKADGERMFTELEDACRGKVILTTPNGHLEQHPRVASRSELHRSAWSAQELAKKGYKVRGIGLRGTSKLRSKKSLTLYGLLNYLSTAMTFFFPELSEYILATKAVVLQTRSAHKLLGLLG